MSNPALHHKITYIEFTTTDIERTRKFYSTVFGWSFQDWGPQYIGFAGVGIDGGFAKGDAQASQAKSAPLVVLYSTDLKATEAAIVAARRQHRCAYIRVSRRTPLPLLRWRGQPAGRLVGVNCSGEFG